MLPFAVDSVEVYRLSIHLSLNLDDLICRVDVDFILVVLLSQNPGHFRNLWVLVAWLSHANGHKCGFPRCLLGEQVNRSEFWVLPGIFFLKFCWVFDTTDLPFADHFRSFFGLCVPFYHRPSCHLDQLYRWLVRLLPELFSHVPLLRFALLALEKVRIVRWSRLTARDRHATWHAPWRNRTTSLVRPIDK